MDAKLICQTVRVALMGGILQFLSTFTIAEIGRVSRSTSGAQPGVSIQPSRITVIYIYIYDAL
jgi:hypothetical protein